MFHRKVWLCESMMSQVEKNRLWFVIQRPRTPCKRRMCVTSGSAHESSQASVTVKFLKVQSKKRGRMVQGVVVCKQNTPVCNVCLMLWMLVHARARDVGVAGGSVGKSPPFPPTTLQQHQNCSKFHVQHQHCSSTNTSTTTVLLKEPSRK